MANSTIEVTHLRRQFGDKVALDDVSLCLQPGTVLGLVGENGAGKTTLIKHLLGLLKPQQGEVRVFGLNPITEPERVLGGIGYLSEEGDLPVWMRISEFMRYTRAFYSDWDPEYADQLIRDFALDPAKRLKDLSKGQRARAGLAAALAHRPKLLLLDEPSSGLDPIVRRDILGAVIRTVADEGRSVLFSSHLLSEVEQVADEVAMIRQGRVIFCQPLDEIKARYSRITFLFESAQAEAPSLAGGLRWEGGAREWSAVWMNDSSDVEAAARQIGAQIVERSGLTLDEIFVAHA